MERNEEEDAAEAERSGGAPENAGQAVSGDRGEPVALPVVVVEVEGATPDNPDGVTAAHVQQDGGEQPDPAPPPARESQLPVSAAGAEALSADIRELIDRIRPQNGFPKFITSHENDGLPEDDDQPVEEAIEYFVSRAEKKMRELRAEGKMPIAHALDTAGPTPGSIAHEIYRHGDNSGAPRIQQLSGPAAATSSTADVEPLDAAPPAQVLLLGGASQESPQIPQLQLFVQLTDARALYDTAIDAALDRKAPKYREIAEAEVKRGFWWHECERRAADHRLRGPG